MVARTLRAGIVAAALAALTGALAYLRGPRARPRSAEDQAELERAVASVDRELAADLELMTMFDQTKQAFVLENGQYLAASSSIEQLAPDIAHFVSDVYARIPEVETAMEQRGPAGSIPETDRAKILEWEGDAREAQRLLRASLSATRDTRGGRLLVRLRERFARRQAGG